MAPDGFSENHEKPAKSVAAWHFFRSWAACHSGCTSGNAGILEQDSWDSCLGAGDLHQGSTVYSGSPLGRFFWGRNLSAGPPDVSNLHFCGWSLNFSCWAFLSWIYPVSIISDIYYKITYKYLFYQFLQRTIHYFLVISKITLQQVFSFHL